MRSTLVFLILVLAAPAYAGCGYLWLPHDGKRMCIGELTDVQPAVCMVKDTRNKHPGTLYWPHYDVSKAECDALGGEYRTFTRDPDDR